MDINIKLKLGSVHAALFLTHTSVCVIDVQCTMHVGGLESLKVAGTLCERYLHCGVYILSENDPSWLSALI